MSIHIEIKIPEKTCKHGKPWISTGLRQGYYNCKKCTKKTLKILV